MILIHDFDFLSFCGSPLPIPIVSADPESSLMMMNFVDCIKEVPDVPIASNLSANKDVNQPPKAGCTSFKFIDHFFENLLTIIREPSHSRFKQYINSCN